MKRAYMFIDGLSLYTIQKAFRLPKSIDFEKWARLLVPDYEVVGINYYSAAMPKDIYPKQYEAQQKLFSAILASGNVSLRLGKLEVHAGRHIDKGIDVLFATDLVSLAYRDAYDTALLVSGNRSLACAVEAVRLTGKSTQNIYPTFELDPSERLSKVCDEFQKLDMQLFGQCAA